MSSINDLKLEFNVNYIFKLHYHTQKSHNRAFLP